MILGKCQASLSAKPTVTSSNEGIFDALTFPGYGTCAARGRLDI